MNMENTQYDEKMRKMKNNRLIVWVLILFGVIIGISQLLDSGSNIMNKILKTPEITKKDSVQNQIIIQPSSPSIIVVPTESKPFEEKSRPAQIKLVQFVVNPDSCYFNSKRLKNNILSIEPIITMDMEGEELPSDYEFERVNSYTKKTEIIKFEAKRYHPFLDFTFFNEGSEKTILTTINLLIDKIEPDQGAGGSSTGSHAIEALNKYKIIIPNLIETFYENPKYKFTKDYPALPPLLVDANDAARVQLILGNKADVMATYSLTLGFVFSNGQKFSEKMIIHF